MTIPQVPRYFRDLGAEDTQSGTNVIKPPSKVASKPATATKGQPNRGDKGGKQANKQGTRISTGNKPTKAADQSMHSKIATTAAKHESNKALAAEAAKDPYMKAPFQNVEKPSRLASHILQDENGVYFVTSEDKQLQADAIRQIQELYAKSNLYYAGFTLEDLEKIPIRPGKTDPNTRGSTGNQGDDDGNWSTVPKGGSKPKGSPKSAPQKIGTPSKPKSPPKPSLKQAGSSDE